MKSLLTALMVLFVASPATAVDVAKSMNDLCQVEPTICSDVKSMRPVPTRAGHLRFVGQALLVDGVEWVFLDRFMANQDEPDVRAALVPTFVELLHDVPQLAMDLYVAEEDAAIRTRIVGQLVNAPKISAEPVLRLALRDASPSVRAEASSVAGYQSTLNLTTALTRALSDSDARVRTMAARSLGWRGDLGSFEALVSHLDDSSASVRLQVLSALKRLDRSRLMSVETAKRLRDDPDPKVARFARTCFDSNSQR